MMVKAFLIFVTILLYSLVGYSVGQGNGIPFCECVNATVDCLDSLTINAIIVTLLDNSATCLNDCSGKCQQDFYYLHVYHEICENAGYAAHEVYHDFSLSCQICDLGSLDVPTIAAAPENECPKVDCSNLEDQKDLTNLLISFDCESDCFSNQKCIQAWKKLTSYHETCPEDSLASVLTKEYHNIEVICPPECVPPATNSSSPSQPVLCDAMSTMKADAHDDHDEKTGIPMIEVLEIDDHGDGRDDEEKSTPMSEPMASGPSCECLIDAASFSCTNFDMLDQAVFFLKQNANTCLNECNMNDTCAQSFYILNTFHAVCPFLSREGGNLYHDFALHCGGCNAGSMMRPSGGPECAQVDCGNAADQDALVDILIDCDEDCVLFMETQCQTAWQKLSAYHETCPEESLTTKVTNRYHEFEEVCAAACTPKGQAAAPKPDCEAEMQAMKP